MSEDTITTHFHWKKQQHIQLVTYKLQRYISSCRGPVGHRIRFTKASVLSERTNHCYTDRMVTNKAAVIVCCLLALCSTLSAGTNITFIKCDQDEVVGKLIAVDVTPCPALPCVFHKGTNVTATITFCPNVMVADGTLQVYGIIKGVPIPFPLQYPDACKYHGLECPLKSNVNYSLKITIPVKPEFPSLELLVQMDLKLPDGKELFCFRFPTEIAWLKCWSHKIEANVIWNFTFERMWTLNRKKKCNSNRRWNETDC